MNRQSSPLPDLFDRNFTVVSTIDHPYPSPPIHLFDGHLRLQRRYGETVLILNWDVSQPLDRFYRYDLITDTGLIAKHSSLYHYQPGTSYSEQRFDTRPFSLLSRGIECAVSAMQTRRRLSDQFAGELNARALDVVRQAEAFSRPEIKPWQYSADLLKTYYKKLEQPQLRALIEHQYSNYWLSPFTNEWIPWCLKSVKGAMSYRELRAKGVFIRTPFRVRAAEGLSGDIPEDAGDIADAVAQGLLVPSLDVFLWSLAIARIEHVGNDFNFFARLAAAVGDPSLKELQRTGDEEDCRRFLKFEDDYGVLLDIDGDKIRPSKRKNQPLKLSRVTDFNSVLVALGDRAIEILQDYVDGKYNDARLSFTSVGCSCSIQDSFSASTNISR